MQVMEEMPDVQTDANGRGWIQSGGRDEASAYVRSGFGETPYPNLPYRYPDRRGPCSGQRYISVSQDCLPVDLCVLMTVLWPYLWPYLTTWASSIIDGARVGLVGLARLDQILGMEQRSNEWEGG